jgi:D-sedoheptulose 7-phosphate isomerase
MDYTQAIKDYLSLERSVLEKLDTKIISDVINTLDAARLRKAHIYVFGNGGSAMTASHFANDFNKGVSEHLEIPFRFVCLNDNIATVMAIANDISYDAVFEFQLRGKVTKDDVILAISGSGNSGNVINAVKLAKETGATVIGLSGFNGGELAKLSDISLNVPVMSMQMTEDVHMIFDHLMMSVLYKQLCGIDHLRK